MGQPSSKDEMTVRHQFDRLCQMALKGEAVNYYKHMDYRRKHEVTFSELSEKPSTEKDDGNRVLWYVIISSK